MMIEAGRPCASRFRLAFKWARPLAAVKLAPSGKERRVESSLSSRRVVSALIGCVQRAVVVRSCCVTLSVVSTS